jgi:hypothetical protein
MGTIKKIAIIGGIATVSFVVGFRTSTEISKVAIKDLADDMRLDLQKRRMKKRYTY